jgi:hypothetical protein
MDDTYIGPPSGDLCAAFDLGALRCLSGRPIVDRSGLMDPSAAQVIESAAADR